MKTIIAATDFSDVSANAAHYAADLAAAMHAELVLVNVVQVPVTVSEIPLTEYEFDEMSENSRQELLALKQRLAEQVHDKINIDIRSTIGTVNFALYELSREKEIFCIVMGTDRTAAVERLFIQNNSLATMHTVTTPVLIIPPNARFQGVKKIALALDLKNHGGAASIKHLQDWLDAFGASLDVVSVVKDAASARTLSSRRLQNELNELHPAFYFVHEDNVEEGINKFIEGHRPDLLVTIPGKYGFAERVFHKSQSKQFIRHSYIPVLSIMKS